MSTDTKATITSEAYALIPGYADADRAVQAATAWTRQLAGPAPVFLDADTELADAAATGSEFPTDLPRRLREVEAAILDWRKAGSMAQQYLADAKARRASTVEHGADLGLAYLAEQMDALVEEVRAADLGTLTADAATIASDPDAAAAIREAAGLVDRYREIRDVQRELVRAASSNRLTDGGTRLFLTVAQIADFIDHEAHWVGLRRVNWRGPSSGAPAREQQAYRAWMAQPSADGMTDTLTWGAPMPRSGGLVEDARFLARLCRECRPWVPQTDVLFQAFELATAATEGLGRNPREAENGIKAIHALEQVTGYASKGTPALPEGEVGGTGRRLPWGHPLRGND